MNMKNHTPDHSHLNAETRRIWNVNAHWWDDKIGDGNAFQCELIEPTTERLLSITPDQTILDIACGAGRFARRMAQLAAHVVALDFSEKFIERARHRTPAQTPNIEYHLIDATDKQQLLGLGSQRFDAAVSSMALMDMSTIDPLMASLPTILKPRGAFVFSVMHPCFHSAGTTRFAELSEADPAATIHYGVKVAQYLSPTACKGYGIIGQPEPHYYFHRSLETLFNTAFRHGFVIDGFAEPALQPAPQDTGNPRWKSMPEIPPVLVVRLRLPAP